MWKEKDADVANCIINAQFLGRRRIATGPPGCVRIVASRFEGGRNGRIFRLLCYSRWRVFVAGCIVVQNRKEEIMWNGVKKVLGVLLLAAVLVSGVGCFSWDSSGRNNDRAPRDTAVAKIDEVVE
jgi:hypothetical protein